MVSACRVASTAKLSSTPASPRPTTDRLGDGARRTVALLSTDMQPPAGPGPAGALRAAGRPTPTAEERYSTSGTTPAPGRRCRPPHTRSDATQGRLRHTTVTVS